ncbi:protein required for mother cell-specific HO expression [Suhomyces tanzawaensis NRRL Y-17324]|uniref:Protein required for mother cell-specific HO expression n=1 Tax=Suhomyces tanzawaensis NRRL Y-17324 TaxID=984487 RepID=A0A1E4SQH8_9ASCO|nr:protein required for mother cell-specific HO expression [Suhomyces tanzawaensis NRRL Y-17324]ODV81761.1 protein required for mother cell-specific HO expression [Suhomyces tanzawaensis NRRL Y-17324]
MAESSPHDTAVEEQLKSLSLESSIENVFRQSTPLSPEQQAQSLSDLVKASQKQETSGDLREVLLDDAETFLKGLYRVGDSRGLVLINTLGSSRSTNDALINNLLNTIKVVIANKNVDTKFYLSIYVAVISNFNHINFQHLGLFLTLLNPLKENYRDVSSLILLIVIRNLSQNRALSTKTISEVLELYLDDSHLEISQFLTFINILSTLFPIVPEVTTPIYTSEKTKEHILSQISRIVVNNKLTLEYPNHVLVATEILKLVSTSCITEESRTYNSKEYFDLLQVGAKVKTNEEVKLLSSLALVKVWSFVQMDKKKQEEQVIGIADFTNNFLDYIKAYNKDPNEVFLEYAVEGLAYLSLNATVKAILRSDEDLLGEIILLIKKKSDVNSTDAASIGTNNSLVYGLVTVLANLSKLKEANQTNRRTINYLKSVATPGSKDSEQENRQEIQLFNKSILLNYKIVEVLTQIKSYKEEAVSNASDVTPNNLVNQVVFIIYSIAKGQEREVRSELVKQGGLSFILSFLIKHTAIQKNGNGETRPINSNSNLIETRLCALRSLSKILISVNPSVAFTKYDVRTAVPFLIELLGPDITKYTGALNNTQSPEQYLHEMTDLDKYESLLALTNLSSDEKNSELRKLIIVKSFDSYLNNFIIDSDNFKIQQASWELITNLIVEPSLLVKFFNIEAGSDGKVNQENLSRLTLLIKLLNSEDESFQIVIAGLLANATSEFEPIPQILVKNEMIKNELVAIISDIFINQTTRDDLILRSSYILMNLVFSVSDMETDELLWFVANEKLKVAVTTVIRQNKRRDILEVLIDVLKMIK